jgi:hypothetical protein
MKLEFFSTDLRKIAQISNFIKILPVGAELFHADRRTDMMKTDERVTQSGERALKLFIAIMRRYSVLQ